MTLPAWGDEKVETIIGNLLIAGVLLSASVVLFGGIIYLIHHGYSIPDYGTFRGEPENLTSVRRIVQYAFQFHGQGIVQLGLLLLIATPVARVAFAVFGFAVQKDRMYTLFTGLVLLILLYSLFGYSYPG